MALHRHELREYLLYEIRTAGPSVGEINYGLVQKLLRHGLAGQFCQLSGWILAELIPAIISHDPVVATFVRDYVNDGDRHAPL
jgi:hypothetical protein